MEEEHGGGGDIEIPQLAVIVAPSYGRLDPNVYSRFTRVKCTLHDNLCSYVGLTTGKDGTYR